jgi:hypothetical protein
MREQGIVTEIRGEKAVVKVLTFGSLGCGCGNVSCRRFEDLEVQNLCGAKKDEWILLESEREQGKQRGMLQTAGSFCLFILGTGLGQVICRALGITGRGGLVFPLLIGLGIGILGFVGIFQYYRRSPLQAPRAVKVIPAPAEKFTEGVCLL